MPQGARRPYENHFASLQGWGHRGCHHLSQLVSGLNSVFPCWVSRLHPPLISYLLPTRLSRELVRSLGMDITLDGILNILDKHYSNVKALDALSKELFQLQMGKKETVSDLGVHLLRHLQILMALFPECFPPDHIAELKWDHFFRVLSKQLKRMVAYLKASGNERTYSDYLWGVHEAEKEEVMESSCNQTVASASKPKVMGSTEA